MYGWDVLCADDQGLTLISTCSSSHCCRPKNTGVTIVHQSLASTTSEDDSLEEMVAKLLKLGQRKCFLRVALFGANPKYIPLTYEYCVDPVIVSSRDMSGFAEVPAEYIAETINVGEAVLSFACVFLLFTYHS
jgi:hypothetical protein